MKKLSFILALLSLTGFTSLQAQQTINQSKSKVEFKITGGGIFNVNGTFTGMKGDFKLKTNDLSNANFKICIDAATINTDNTKRDTHLRSSDFFNVEKYPSICFVSSSITKTADGFITKGKLTLHGISKIVEIPFTFSNNTFVGNITINRFDYKLGEDYGTFRVGTEALVTITCVVG